MSFKEISIKDLTINPFQSIGHDWFLITAGDEIKINTMTASWANMGVLWGENVIIAYIRPQRYTKEFVDANDCFSISFFNGMKKEMTLLGKVSGRDTDKIKETNLTITYLNQVPTFEEANLVFIVEKIYIDTIKPECFLDTSLDEKWYPQRDHHTIYIARIKKIYTKA